MAEIEKAISSHCANPIVAKLSILNIDAGVTRTNAISPILEMLAVFLTTAASSFMRQSANDPLYLCSASPI
jgi:hypothetical protein